jgi:quinol monooxygenase YgiN
MMRASLDGTLGLMLLITAYVEVAPSDRDAIRAALPDVIAGTRREEGCDEYGCYEDTERPGRFVFVERWRDRAALDRHIATPHMAAWMTVLGPRVQTAKGAVHEVSASTELRPK